MVGEAPPAGLRQRCQKSETVRHGASREWYPDHRERTYTEWWDGQKHGRFRFWFKNGQLRSEGAHAYGQPAGKWTYYAEDGKVRQEQTFPTASPPESWLADAIAGRPPPPAPAQEPIVPAEDKDAPPPDIRKPGAAASAPAEPGRIAKQQDASAQRTE